MRNRPSQDRSAHTVEAILEATTQILDTPHEASITTNHIAQRAGVSVGSLYRYFNNKQDILSVIVQREGKRLENQISVLIAEWSGEDVSDLIREIARLSVDSFQGRRWVRRSLHKYLLQKDSIDSELHALRYRVLLRLEEKLSEKDPNTFRMISDEERHAILGAWAGMLKAVTLYSPNYLSIDPLSDQLVDIINTYLRKEDQK